MAIITHRSGFSYLLVAAVCVSIGFLMGRSDYGQQLVLVKQQRTEAMKAPLFHDTSAQSGKQDIPLSAETDGKQDLPPSTQTDGKQNLPLSTPIPDKPYNLTAQSKHLCNIHDIHAPSNDKHECLKTKWQPPFHICIHPVQKDIYVSKSIKNSGIWEKHVLGIFQSLLKKDSTYGVIDIGANIGQYALMAAVMGRPVVAVEARLLHVEMIHHAVELNHLADRSTDFILLHNAISNNHNELEIRLTESFNQGHTQIVERGPGSGIPKTEVRKVPAITMDDLTEVVHFSKAIVKMDIEGSEHRAIAHCEKLLSKVYIPYMFMEWLWQRKNPNEYTIVNILSRNGYVAYGLDKKMLPKNSMRRWPVDIIWKHHNATF